jgi:hypothetical protein
MMDDDLLLTTRLMNEVAQARLLAEMVLYDTPKKHVSGPVRRTAEGILRRTADLARPHFELEIPDA